MGKVFHEDAVRSAPWLVIGKTVSFIIYFIISILIVKGLGKEDYGLFVMSKSAGSYLLIACALGLNRCILRYVPEMAVKKNYAQIKKFIYKSLKYQLYSLMIVAAAILLFRDQLPSLDSKTGIVICLLFWMAVLLWKMHQ